jgi:hypothetical protein
MKLGICTSVTMPPVVMPNLGIPEYYSTAAPHGETDAERMLPFGRFKGQTKFKIGTVLTAFLGHKVCLLVANIST